MTPAGHGAAMDGRLALERQSYFDSVASYAI